MLNHFVYEMYVYISSILSDHSPIDCEWNEWQYGECSRPCGGGKRINTRTKKTEEKYGGSCKKEAYVWTQECNPQPCQRMFLGIDKSGP